MPSKKQRRRRDKERRHEYEYVYVDEEGRELEVEEAEPETKKQVDKKPSGGTAPTGRRGRQVQPPSWQRVFRRAAIFAPLMLIVLYLIKPKNSSTTTVVLNAVILIALFVPFSYFMDRLLWRQYQKRQGGAAPSGKRPGRRK